VSVHFIGAGPGAADLITVRGRDLLARCTVCLYAGSLVPVELLAVCPPGARLVDTQGLHLDQILAELVDAHHAGHEIARLCSGDPSVYSAITEQIRRLDEAGVPYDITPGVPAFAAAAATLRQELTVPGVGQTVVLTRTSARATPMPPGESITTLGAARATMVLHLAVQRIAAVVEELVPNYGADCPVAVVANASRENEVVLHGSLATIAGQVGDAGIKRTAVIIVGQVLALPGCESHLYSAHRSRD
jgi:precorrin-4/cobalt-precorrin-4 C11-methyltransferase